ncbi:uncharacterized protein LOC107874646 [Capsicum annuum]|uniref:uncharacterized protein LOC107874646 n=1 Tax=Capsicum annuum TaxID=4072 RepID=UPI0007BF3F70|nr:uncharacterized protein LOC107874646 [Capsicum annuum]
MDQVVRGGGGQSWGVKDRCVWCSTGATTTTSVEDGTDSSASGSIGRCSCLKVTESNLSRKKRNIMQTGNTIQVSIPRTKRFIEMPKQPQSFSRKKHKKMQAANTSQVCLSRLKTFTAQPKQALTTKKLKIPRSVEG